MAWHLAPEMYRETAQTLQEGRKMIRSVENIALSLEPLASDKELRDLERIAGLSAEMTGIITGLYNGIARKAFGSDDKPKVVR